MKNVVFFSIVVTKMGVEELHQLNAKLLIQIQSKWFYSYTVKFYCAAELTQHFNLRHFSIFLYYTWPFLYIN